MNIKVRVKDKKLRKSSKVRLYEAALSQLLSAKAEEFRWQESLINASVELMLHGSVKVHIDKDGRITTVRSASNAY